VFPSEVHPITAASASASALAHAGLAKRGLAIPSLAHFALALLALASFAPGCKTPDEYKADADRSAYKLVLERRAQLKVGDPAFTIEPNPESLRQRMLRGEVAAPPPLSLMQCIDIAAENSRDFQSQKEDLYLAALDLTLARYAFQVQDKGVITATLLGDGDEAAQVNTNALYTFSKLFGTGAKIVGDIGISFMKNLLSSDGWHPITDVGIAATQPLLRGFGKSIVEEPLTQAERNLVYAARSFERFRRTFAVDAANRYYGVLELRDAVVNQEANVKSLTQLTERNQALAEAGRLSDIDVGQARQDELSSRVNLLAANERLANTLDSLKLFMGLPIEFELALDPNALTELTQAKIADLVFDEHHAIEFALANRLDYLNRIDQVGDSERQIAVAADALRAQLDVAAQIHNPSQNGQPSKFNFQDATWSAGLVLDLPFDRLPERNAYRKALVSHEVAFRSREQAADQIAADVREELRLTDERRQAYDIQQSAMQLAEQRVASIRLKLEAGRTDTRTLLEAERSLLDAQNAVTAALIDYNISRLALLRDLEVLRVDHGGVDVDPAMLRAAQPTAAEPGPNGGSKTADSGSKPEGDA
jgi:outer membrane protein TolC